jgi:hypothetical protein
VIEPIRFSMPSDVAPPMVAIQTTSSARSRLAVIVSFLAWASRWSRERSALSVARMAEKKSALHHTLVSMDSDAGMPYLRSSQVDGYPWPALCSLSQATDTVPPVAAIFW